MALGKVRKENRSDTVCTLGCWIFKFQFLIFLMFLYPLRYILPPIAALLEILAKPLGRRGHLRLPHNELNISLINSELA